MLRNMNFDIVITPLLLSCDDFFHPERRHVFQCGDYTSLSEYCISGSHVCDGHVNCMIPGREGIDEEEKYCRNTPIWTSQSEFTQEQKIIFLSCLLIPLVLFCCCSICKLYRFFVKKRNFFIKVGEELEGRNIIVAKSASTVGQEANGINKPDTIINTNYVEIIHENDEN